MRGENDARLGLGIFLYKTEDDVGAFAEIEIVAAFRKRVCPDGERRHIGRYDRVVEDRIPFVDRWSGGDIFLCAAKEADQDLRGLGQSELEPDAFVCDCG